MAFGRLRRRFTRTFIVSWRDQPTRLDIEALQANVRRVGLVIRVRWILIVVLIMYSLLAASAYAARMDILELARLMAVPAATLGVVVLYNSYYAMNYRRLGNIAVWNNLQLALDAMVVTVLVYFSGGVNSWFWSMYALFILEAAFILPNSRATWAHALFSCGLLGGVVAAEYLGLLPHVSIPYASDELHSDFVFMSVRFLWQVAVLMGIAWVSTNLVGEFRRELAALRAGSLTDELTGLSSRSHFLRSLTSELRRAERDGREVHVMLIDVDHFGLFNERFGIERGDRMLKEIARSLSTAIEPAGDHVATVNLAARIGGEEFAVLFAEDERLKTTPCTDDAYALAEQVRASIATAAVEDAGVAVSVGLASYPLDGRTADELMDAADVALGCAGEQGGNRVIRAADCVPESASVDGAS